MAVWIYGGLLITDKKSDWPNQDRHLVFSSVLLGVGKLGTDVVKCPYTGDLDFKKKFIIIYFISTCLQVIMIAAFIMGS